VTNAAVESLDPRRQSGMKGWARAEPAVKYGAATAAKRRAAAVKHRTAAVERRTPAAMKAATTAVEATAAVEAATMAATAMTATTAMASDFSRNCTSSGLRCGQRASTWQRQRVGAMRSGREHQHRGGRKTQTLHKATDRAALWL
jgi:hypothetical protein